MRVGRQADPQGGAPTLDQVVLIQRLCEVRAKAVQRIAEPVRGSTWHGHLDCENAPPRRLKKAAA